MSTMSITESVRDATQRETARLLALQQQKAPAAVPAVVADDGAKTALRLPHVTVVPPEQLQGKSAMLEEIRHHTLLSVPSNKPAGASAIDHSQWLMSVPRCLRHDVAAITQYLAMLVAIDFRHWGEKPCELTEHELRARGIAVPPGPTQLAAVGERVTSFTGFYTIVQPPPATAAAAPTAGQQGGAARAAEVPYPEQRPVAGAGAGGQTFIRGSAAMMHLLREAVDVHGLHWYDPAFLARYHTVEEAMEALKPCFFGCEIDGVTPMWMPATRQRVELILSLRDVFLASHTTFYDILKNCDGYVFGRPNAFVPRLRALHPRYQDVARAPEIFGDDREFPILKLSQLTVLALNEALPALWRAKGPQAELDCAWLREARDASAHAAAKQAAGEATTVPNLFKDGEAIAMCCDYQIPKALRSAGLLVYDDYLANLVDNQILLAPSSIEEVAIRVATLISTEWLVAWLNAPADTQARSEVELTALDHGLWYVGRYITEASAKHHLCRTIMY